MRLLAVRGAQLASLGPFAIELEAAPLAETRIFAIVGPTGAGKSTLLDAVCLALYDRVPRLLDAKDAGIGVDDLGPNDPRALMRRGAAEAYAEVDFVDRDGTRCRARWDVWRARKRADGRIQNQRLSLFDLDRDLELTGATKTETLSQIEDRLGLSFEEFRRAVLLAQGDFSAFLRAPSDERANLLEKMTGTQLFGALSRAAHAQCKEAAQLLTQVETERGAIQVLADTEVHDLETERKTRVAARRTHAELLARTEQVIRWHDDLQRAQDTVSKTTAALSIAHEAADAAAADRRALERTEAAEHLRAPYEAWVRARRQAEETQARRQSAQDVLTETETQLAAGRARFEAARAARIELQKRRDAEAQALAEARDLDGRVAEATAGQEESRRRLEERAANALTAQQALDTAVESHEAASAVLRGVLAWLTDHASLEALVAQWPTVERTLLRGQELLTRSAQTAADRERIKAALEKARADRNAATAARLAATERLTESQSKLHNAQGQLNHVRETVPPRDRREAMEALAELKAGLERLRTLLPNARRLDRRIKEETRARRVALKHAKTAKAELEKARAQQRTAREGLDRVLAEVTRVEAVQAVSQRRAELLVEGEPCPLCGSTSHPHAHAEAVDNPRLSSLRARRTRLDNDLSQAKQTADAARAAVRTHRAEAKDALIRKDEAEEDLRILVETWSGGRDALKLVWLRSALLTQRNVHKLYLGIDEDPTAKDARTGLGTAVEALDTARADLAAWAEQEDEALQAVEAAQQTRDDRDLEQRTAVETVHAAEARVADLERERMQLDERYGALNAEWRESIASIEGVLGAVDALARAHTEPVAVAEALTGRVDAFRREAATAATQRDRVNDLAATLAMARVDANRASASVDEARDQHSQAEKRHAKLREERSKRLGGRPVDDYERAVAAREAEADAEVAAAQTTLAAAETAHAAAASRHLDATAAEKTHEAQCAEALARLEDARSTADFTPEELDELLGRDAEWRTLVRARIAAIAEQAIRAEAQAEAARRQLEEHERSGRPDLDRTAAVEAHGAAQSAFETEIAALGRIDERLSHNAEARARQAELDSKVTTRRQKLELWSELNAVIGSADGKKLRTFAQGLTLESLIAQANLHLTQLRPRYRLGRVPYHDMDLMVIDRDLGDEPRALSSLSGGETFLVSLALALALSTLSARNVRIESLFIDEGFGALDAEALEIALATLDQLQSEGRMIGLISHIPDLADRIGYRVEVKPTGPGVSEVRVRGV